MGLRAQIDYAGCRGTQLQGQDGAVVRGQWSNEVCRFKLITDGLSNTMMVGERWQSIEWYYKFEPYENDWHRGGWVAGYRGSGNDSQTSLMTTVAPSQDFIATTNASKLSFVKSFGSAHPGAFNVVICDGSVRSVNYNVALPVFLNFGDRDDGNAFSPGDLN
jgi:hypothetical protein